MSRFHVSYLFYFHPSHPQEKCTKAPFVNTKLHTIALVTDISSRALAIRDSTGDRVFNIQMPGILGIIRCKTSANFFSKGFKYVLLDWSVKKRLPIKSFLRTYRISMLEILIL